jgi:hypothetical protein
MTRSRIEGLCTPKNLQRRKPVHSSKAATAFSGAARTCRAHASGRTRRLRSAGARFAEPSGVFGINSAATFGLATYWSKRAFLSQVCRKTLTDARSRCITVSTAGTDAATAAARSSLAIEGLANQPARMLDQSALRRADRARRMVSDPAAARFSSRIIQPTAKALSSGGYWRRACLTAWSAWRAASNGKGCGGPWRRCSGGP